MNKKSIVSEVLALTLAVGALPAVYAQQNGRDDGRPGQRDDRRGPPDRHDDHRNDRRGPPDRHDERGAGPNHAFHRGDRLPPEYRNRQYVVNNWREHHLSAPPRGYQWVQTGGDYVLAAIGTGIILQLLLGQ